MRILVVSENDMFARWVLFCLAVEGHQIHAMTPGSLRLTRLSRYCRGHLPCDRATIKRSDPSLLEPINRYCVEHRIEWLVPVDLPASLLLARGRSRLQVRDVFPLSDAAVIERLHDKWELYQLLRELGLPTPRTWRLDSVGDAARGPWEFPVMLKPPRGENSNGVRRVDSQAELSALIGPHAAAFGWPLLLQEFIQGRDTDLSALSDRGRIVAWTVQRAKGAGASLEFLEHPEMLETAAAILRPSGYHGVVHFDMRVDERTQRALVIEANPRFWGSLRHSYWSGVNFAALGLALAQRKQVGGDFRPPVGVCQDPGFSIATRVRTLLRGRWRPEGWSPATEAAWRCRMSDPLPELWLRLRGLSPGRVPGPDSAQRA